MTAASDPTVWTTIGAAIAAAATGAAGWFAGRKTRNAAEDAQVARLGVEQVEAQAENTIYTRMIERITRTEEEIRRLNHELDAERRLRRVVENHVAALERMMRSAGITPPEMPGLSVNEPQG